MLRIVVNFAVSQEEAALPDYRQILLCLICSLSLCDNMSDVAGDVGTALKQIGEEIEWDDLEELGEKLRAKGISTLYGTL